MTCNGANTYWPSKEFLVDTAIVAFAAPNIFKKGGDEGYGGLQHDYPDFEVSRCTSFPQATSEDMKTLGLVFKLPSKAVRVNLNVGIMFRPGSTFHFGLFANCLKLGNVASSVGVFS